MKVLSEVLSKPTLKLFINKTNIIILCYSVNDL